jgi:mRNA interferase MazF
MKAPNGMNYKQKEIVLVPFPYSDLNAIKKRPVLIVSNNDYNTNYHDVMVCVITSKTYADEYSIQLSDKDLEFGVLPEKSLIKTHKIFTISQNRIIKKFSIINDTIFQLVSNKIKELVSSK